MIENLYAEAKEAVFVVLRSALQSLLLEQHVDLFTTFVVLRHLIELSDSTIASYEW